MLHENYGQGNGSYPEAILSFGMTLNFHSSKAYDDVWKTFDICLPSPRQFEMWSSSVNGDPGFTQQFFLALQCRVAENFSQG